MEARLKRSIETGNTYIRRFSSIAAANAYREGSTLSYTIPVILGDDGKFWLAPTPRAAYKLIDWGFDVA